MLARDHDRAPQRDTASSAQHIDGGRNTAAPAGATVRPTADQLLSAPGGLPLPSPVLQRMEQAFGTGFGRVRVHRGPQAEAFDAAAFTVGERIFLPPSAPPLHSSEGHALLGHELTHVLQQRHGRVRAAGPGISVDPHPGLEAEAEAAGASVARGESPALSSHPHASASSAEGATVQRRPRFKGLMSLFRRGRPKQEEEGGLEMTSLVSAEAGPLRAVAESPAPTRDPATAVDAPAAPTGDAQPAHSGAPSRPVSPVEPHIQDYVARELNAYHERHTEAKAQRTAAKLAEQAQERAKAKQTARDRKSKSARNEDAQNQLQHAAQARVTASQQLAQTLSTAAGLAGQAEASGKAFPPAAEPSVDWAQPQPVGDTTLPPPLSMPERPQPEPPAALQPDQPLSVGGPLTVKHERRGLEGQVKAMASPGKKAGC